MAGFVLLVLRVDFVLEIVELSRSQTVDLDVVADVYKV